MSGRALNPTSLTAALAASLVLGGCTALAASRSSAPPPGSLTTRVSPLHDPRGLHPSLTPVPAAGLPAARAAIAKVRTAPAGTLAGYDRVADFGAAWTDQNTTTWGHDGCATREEVLHRDLSSPTFRPGGCVVLTGTLKDPYTATSIAFSKSDPTRVQIDHVMPLAYDWAQGAKAWSMSKRVAIANDPLNLLAVDGPTNEAKGDKGPATWLPPNTAEDCAHAVRFALVSKKYALAVTPADKAAMQKACIAG